MSKAFLDTNFLVYGLDGKDPVKQRAALDTLIRARTLKIDLVVSTQVLQEYYNALTRKLSIAPSVAKHEMMLLARYQVVLLEPKILGAAADLHATDSISFWDALIVVAAQSAHCDELWTEDMQTGRSFGQVKIVNPFAAA
jgi:predicted nucleic acid-binding protein